VPEEVGLCPNLYLFISFACPKEMNQRKRQPQIFFGINILSAAHAIQLALRLPADRSNSIAYFPSLQAGCFAKFTHWVNFKRSPLLRSQQNVTLFPKKIWWHYSPYGDMVLIDTIYINTEINHEFILVTDN
jgi:hypothetical protein